MSTWPTEATWYDPTQINAGNMYESADGVTADAFNKLICDLLYLEKLDRVVEVSTLPTENIDENVTYLYAGSYYRYSSTLGWRRYVVPEGHRNITQNVENLDVTTLASISVNVKVANLQAKDDIVVSANGKVTIEPDENYDGLSSVTVDVDVPTPAPVLQEKTATENGDVVADEGFDGLSKVKVDVPIPALEGTAIPVGEPVERIYFNTNLTVEETNAYLSQLTYVQTDLFESPIACPHIMSYDSETVIAIIIEKDAAWANYAITIYRVNFSDSSKNYYLKIYDDGWYIERALSVDCSINGYWVGLSYPSLTDFNGLPIGLENEKIKNVMSITPFVAEGEIIPEWDGSFTKSVNNLTGTTWEIPSGWKTSADQGGFAIEGEFTIDNTTLNINSLHLGVYAVTSGATYQANSITVTKAEDNSVHAITSELNTSGFTLKITGGADVTNTYLATWLGSDGQDTTKAIISFTIDGTSYNAKHHMTWEEWVASDYNTDNYAWYQEGSSYYLSKNGDTTVAVAYDGDYVEPADTIVSRRAYVSIT